MKPLQKNQILPLEITALSHEGKGIGRQDGDGMVVFVPAAAVGDQVEVTITKVQKRYAEGEIHRILVPSASRVEPECPVYPACGGCALRHISYGEECKAKEQFLQENLQRIGKLTPPLESILPAPTEKRYRNKVQLVVRRVGGKAVTGFFAPKSHRLIPVADCLLLPEEFSRLAVELCAFLEEKKISCYEEQTHQGLVRHLYLRKAEGTGEVMVVLVLNGRELPRWEQLLARLQGVCPQLATLLLNHNTKRTNLVTGREYTVLYGDGVLVDNLLGVELELSPDSFFQVNHKAAAGLYQQAMDYANPQPDETLLDLYCGVGSIGLTMAHRVKALIGVEVIPAAVENARRNASRNGILNARFLCADAGEATATLTREGLQPDIVVVDPPRKGVDEAALAALVTLAPKRIVYVSCDSATLARDCAVLAEQGYQIVRGRAVDLFPRTYHVECVILMQRSGVKGEK